MKNIYTRILMYSLYGILLQISLHSLVLATTPDSAQEPSTTREIYLNLELDHDDLLSTFRKIEQLTDFNFVYNGNEVDERIRLKNSYRNTSLYDILIDISKNTKLGFKRVNSNINVRKLPKGQPATVTEEMAAITVSGKVTSQADREGLPGVNVLVKNTTIGAVTDVDGNYNVNVPNEDDTLVFSSIGFLAQEIPVSGRAVINMALVEDVQSLEEVVVVGYGTQKKSDLTGSVVRADIEAFEEQPNVSIMQSLQGSVAGMNVGQVSAAGEEPDISIRGRTSLSGQQSPLIVVDGIIFRGNIVDINPNDIKSVDILKDVSSAAIYGSQASNGVVLITTKSGKEEGKPIINYSTYYTIQTPANEFIPGTADDYIQQIRNADALDSRTMESGYLEPNPDYDPTTRFKTNDMINAYNAGLSTNWYDLVTNNNPSIQNHNLSLSSKTKSTGYFMSVGYTKQIGYMVNEDYGRWNARINLDNQITDWLSIGVQSFVTTSDYSGQEPGLGSRYIPPYALAKDENGEITVQPGGDATNPLRVINADNLDKRLNLFGNIYADINLPFIQGLSYKIRYSNNYRMAKEYYFRPYAQNFQGEGSKSFESRTDYSFDNILTYKRTFANVHNVDLTLVYGIEERMNENTTASATIFINDELGYNALQAGSSTLQTTSSGAWREASLYNMGRLFYGFKSKYLFTGTIRRDGFSGFGEDNKFGIFPSASLAWVASEESFIKNNISWLDFLKFRASYGSNGNRTVGRYQTLARVTGGFQYVTADGTPLYGQAINELANPALKWETTTGLNIGVDFGIFKSRISGYIEYYSNNTKDLLYEVDIPGITRYETFPSNLGKLHNNGLNVSISSINIDNGDLRWNSSVTFSRNRDEIRELLGFDNDGDGKEDDIIASGLFIGQPLNTIFDLKITGELFQLGEEIPSGFDLGAFKIEDINGDGVIDPNDRTIVGYREPSYRLSIMNEVRYKNWSLNVFINAIQGGQNYYYGENDLTGFNSINSENLFQRNFPVGMDYWLPENPGATYQKLNINVSGGLQGTRYVQRNFIRLQDVSLAYNFNPEILNKIHMKNLKLFVSGKNLATLTNWQGWDPETGEGITRGGRPVMRSYSFGLNLEF